MQVFLTGATGFIGSYLVPELIQAGHKVTGLSRSDTGAEALARAGAENVRGDVNDLARLRAPAAAADGVIHAAFNHDFSNMQQHSEADRKVIETLGQALTGSDRPLVITSGTGLARSKTGRPAVEIDDHLTSAEYPRAATEEAADALIAGGAHVMVMRLPQVHDTRKQGTITPLVEIARRKGRAAYVGEGRQRRSAAHVSDVVRLYRLALEKGEAGARYHAAPRKGSRSATSRGDRRRAENAGRVDPAGRSAGLLRFDGGPCHHGSSSLQRAYAPAARMGADRAGPADRPSQYGLQRGLGSLAASKAGAIIRLMRCRWQVRLVNDSNPPVSKTARPRLPRARTVRDRP